MRVKLRFGGRSGKSLEFLAGLEADGFAGRNADLLAGAGIAADAGLARLDVEDAEAAKLDALSAAESVLHGLENGFNRLFGFASGNIGLCHDGIDDVELNHESSLVQCGRKSMLDRGLRVVKPSTV
jgi:hypothetical protein